MFTLNSSFSSQIRYTTDILKCGKIIYALIQQQEILIVILKSAT